MWKFKPDEQEAVPDASIHHNGKYINKYSVITPDILQPYTLIRIFPTLSELYTKTPHWITKSYIGRLLYVYINGGIYCDVDCFIRKEFDTKHAVILFTEHVCASVDDLGPRECKDPDNVVRIANYCFGSGIRLHPFLKEVIDECLQRLHQLLIVDNLSELTEQDMLWVCGPDVITTIYHKKKHLYDDVHLYDTSYLDHKCYGSWRSVKTLNTSV